MSERPRTAPPEEKVKEKSPDSLTGFLQEQNARLSGKEISLDAYKRIKEAVGALEQAPDAKKELNSLLSGKKITIEDFKRLRGILLEREKTSMPSGELLSAVEIQKKKMGIEPEAGTKEETGGEKKELTEEEKKTLSNKRLGFVGSQKRAGHTEKMDWGWNFDDLVRDRAKKEMEAGLAKKPSEERAENDIEKRFRESFTISKKELQEIPGYGKLTDGQKEMVFENLRQVTLGRIQEEAEKEHKKNTTESKFLGRIWQGISKRYQIAKLEKEHAEKFSYAGLEAHGKILEKLILGAKEGPEAIRKDDGTVEIRFFGDNNFEKLAGRASTESEKTVIQQFNGAVSAFSKIPYEWSLPSATRHEQHEFKNAKLHYELNRGYLLTELTRVTGSPRALKETIALDGKVEMTQFLSSNPNVEKELQTINSKKLWVRAFQNVATERGLYFAFGAASRSVAVGLLGVLGAPLAAAGMGAFIAHGRAKETLSTEAHMSRLGHVKTVAREKASGERVMRESRDYAKAEILAKRIDSLIQKLGDGDQKSEIHLKHLDRLVQLAESKLEDGLVNFGKDAQRIENQFTLTKRLGMARAHLFEKKHRRELHERLDIALAGRKEKISQEQKKYVRGQILKGALLAGAFAGAGRIAAEYLYHTGAAPSETPVATPDEEAEIGRAMKEATDAEIGGIVGFTPEQLSENVKSGDSVWNITQRKLEALYGAKFAGLNDAQKTYVIDAIKDGIGENPSEHGITDIDRIKIGETLSFKGILDNKDEMNRIFESANDLDDGAQAHIEANNQKISEWVSAHPGEQLDTARVEEILNGAESGPQQLARPETDYTHDASHEWRQGGYYGVTEAEAQAFGSREEALFATKAGLSNLEYRAISYEKVGKLLSEIRSAEEARAIWEGRVSGRIIDLPRVGQYDRNEFEGHVRLSEIIRRYVEGHPHEELIRDMSVRDFLKAVAPLEGDMRPAGGIGALTDAAEAARPSGIPMPEAPHIPPESLPADEIIGTTKIEGKDILLYGTAQEALVAQKLEMIPREWSDIKFIDTQTLLAETPENGSKMSRDELWRFYEAKKPKLPEHYKFDSFMRQTFLADEIRNALKDNSQRDYLEKLPVGEIVRILVLQKNK